ncbi:MAG: hypothetical protein E6G35_09450 [Actinobacteria bacterium]|nr:MAG: hypothetical protein E6G35_09450 [Actinomycetota bacterium]
MPVTLFLMTRKGLAVLDAVVNRYGPSAVGRVVGAADPAVELDYAPDGYCLAVGWRWLVRGTDRLAVIHDSLLPRYRGFAPLVSCLVNGEPRIGATALLASAGYDEGDILAQEAVDVSYPIRVADAIELLAPVYARLAVGFVGQVLAGGPVTGTPQDHSRATYALWRDDEDYRIDWTRPAGWIRRFVDVVGHPYRGASALVGDRLVRVLAAQERPDVPVENRTAGKVILVDGGRPVVVCGEGLLRIDRLVDDATGEPLLPLARFRTRFGWRPDDDELRLRHRLLILRYRPPPERRPVLECQRVLLDQVPGQERRHEGTGDRDGREGDVPPPGVPETGEDLLTDETVDVDAVRVVVPAPDPAQPRRQPDPEPHQEVPVRREAEQVEAAGVQRDRGDHGRPDPEPHQEVPVRREAEQVEAAGVQRDRGDHGRGDPEPVVYRDPFAVQLEGRTEQEQEAEIHHPPQVERAEQRHGDRTVRRLERLGRPAPQVPVVGDDDEVGGEHQQRYEPGCALEDRGGGEHTDHHVATHLIAQ